MIRTLAMAEPDQQNTTVSHESFRPRETSLIDTATSNAVSVLTADVDAAGATYRPELVIDEFDQWNNPTGLRLMSCSPCSVGGSEIVMGEAV
ncbi:MAG: hypothetical protein GEU98_02850 [Pseudonocardiaceae bacterium]|nr:hypothetical protein [Pseudonocardiaceae bacterium]